ncbi:MAG: SURF1 family protein [Alphaproteobacteria bacterium]|nr:SURF1 family protein [Alphaproteobacteria bacterium]
MPPRGTNKHFVFSWPLTLAALPVLGVLVALGTWQVERMQWKRGLLAERAQRLSAPPLNLPAVFPIPGALEFRRVQVQGRFLHDHELYLGNRPRNGQLGYHVITPLVRADGSAVLVDRGWVPLDRKVPQSRAEGQLDGQVVVQGIARLPYAPGMFTPKNQVEGNFWFTIDLPEMARAAGLQTVLPIYVEAGPQQNPGGLPVGGQTDATLPDNHLVYALTWYALAIALVVVYVLRSMKEE